MNLTGDERTLSSVSSLVEAFVQSLPAEARAAGAAWAPALEHSNEALLVPTQVGGGAAGVSSPARFPARCFFSTLPCHAMPCRICPGSHHPLHTPTTATTTTTTTTHTTHTHPAGQLRVQGCQPVRGRRLPAARLLLRHQQAAGHHLAVGQASQGPRRMLACSLPAGCALRALGAGAAPAAAAAGFCPGLDACTPSRSPS
jgi:hypothetical protein